MIEYENLAQTLSNKELDVLEGLKALGWKQIVRNHDGHLKVYDTEDRPHMLMDKWYHYGNKQKELSKLSAEEDVDKMFGFISWENQRRIVIKEMIEDYWKD